MSIKNMHTQVHSNFFLSLFIYFERERGREKVSRGGGERERERESQADSALTQPRYRVKLTNYETMT